jgi:hypothetical protein
MVDRLTLYLIAGCLLFGAVVFVELGLTSPAQRTQRCPSFQLGLDPTVVSPAAKLAGGREVGSNYRQSPSNRLPATRV